ncbi:MAG: serine/threonine-protein kinase [Pseudomonadota bacterium]
MAVALALDPTDFALDVESSPEPPARLGGYMILDRLAEGGMAAIFRGQDIRTGALVALKTVSSPLPSQIEGLDREIAMLRHLQHPGIVRLLGDGIWNGLPWLALELLDGATLFEEIATLWATDTTRAGVRASSRAHGQQEPSPASWALTLDGDPALAPPRRTPAAGRLGAALAPIVRLAAALDHIHDHGIVHRDLKPENVVVSPGGHVTLLDFGLACWPRQRARTEPKRWRMGTAEYAAPEQTRGDRVDARADLYALGCILYEIVTGCRPFDGISPDDIVQQHLECDPRPPSELVAGLSWKLEDLILALLAKEPRRRPRRAGAVAAALLRLVPAADLQHEAGPP